MPGGRDVPDVQRFVLIAAGDQPRAVRAEGQRAHKSRMGQDRAAFASHRVPQAHGLVPATRGDPLSVRAVRHRIDVAGVAAQHGRARLKAHLPEPHRAILRAILRVAEARQLTHGNQPAAARGERQVADVPGVPVQDSDVVPVRRFPEPDGPVRAPRGDAQSVRAVHRRHDFPRVTIVGRLNLPARRGIPLADGPIRRGRHEAPAIRVERDAQDLACVPSTLGDHRCLWMCPIGVSPHLRRRWRCAFRRD